MVIHPNLNLDGLQVKVVKETARNTKLLKGSMGVITYTVDYVHVENCTHAVRASVVFHKMGKTGKFRLTEKRVYLPILYAGSAGKKAGIELESGIKISDQMDIMKYSENAFIAWVAGRIMKYHRMLRELSNVARIGHGKQHDYQIMANVTDIIDGMVIGELRSLLGAGSIIAKEDYPCLVELSRPEARPGFIKIMRDLYLHCAIIELRYKYIQLKKFRSTIHNLDSHIARILLKTGCPESMLMDRRVPKTAETEPYGRIYNKMYSLLAYVDNEVNDLQTYLQMGNKAYRH